MSAWLPILLFTAAAAGAILLRRPLGAAAGLALRSAAGLGGLWLFNLAGGLIGVKVGLNLLSALIVGALGLPGLGLLLLLQCL